MSDRVPGDISKRMSDKISDKISKNISIKVLKYLPDRMPED